MTKINRLLRVVVLIVLLYYNKYSEYSQLHGMGFGHRHGSGYEISYRITFNFGEDDPVITWNWCNWADGWWK